MQLQAANDIHDHRSPRRLLRLRVVMDRTGLSRTTIYRLMEQPGGFPMPVRITPGLIAWVEAEIEAWIEQKILIDRVSSPELGFTLNAMDAAIAAWCTTPVAKTQPITTHRVLCEALNFTATPAEARGMASKVGRAMARLGFRRIEDKKIPERFRYEKPSTQEEKAR